MASQVLYQSSLLLKHLGHLGLLLLLLLVLCHQLLQQQRQLLFRFSLRHSCRSRLLVPWQRLQLLLSVVRQLRRLR